jgi:4a-hydroxytetrahydrobiopterin dehydratase
MNEAVIDKELRELTGWERRDDRIVKTFVFDEFRSATKFVGRVADAAVAAEHEPEIEVRSNQVTLAVFTPDAGTITGPDLALARRVDRLTGDHRPPVGMAGP